ncbi:MAG: hypothetical protein GY916_14235, partial [Gammaproteobacteria bacterium]|nr:hypothetical protein [Gammaproteobacteria bacterium]
LNTNGATGPDGNGFTYTVSNAGAAAVVTITHVGTDDGTVNTMLGSATFNNTTNENPSTTARTVTLTSVTDSGSGTTLDGTVATVNVAPVNDAPVLTGDLSASVNEGAAYILTGTDLGYTDPDDVDAGVTFTTSAASNGKIQVNGIDATSFTGTDLTAGLVTFVHDGSETVAASFDVNVEDGNEDVSTPVDSTFNFTVTPVNDAPTFDLGDGIVTTDIASGTDNGRSVTVQPDGKILVGGLQNNGSNWDIALTRYNADGSLDISFGGGDGIVTTDIGSSHDMGYSITVQSDGKILVGGASDDGGNYDFALTRYNSDGTLDTGFGGGDGIVTTAIGSGQDFGISVAVQSDGKILLGGYNQSGGNKDFALTRYNSDGTLDTSFGGGDGIVTTGVGAGNDLGQSITVQSDGKILLGGYSYNGSNNDFALTRYNSDGTLDTSFGGGDGIATTDIGSGDDQGYSITLQSDGKILVCGISHNGSNYDSALTRYNSDGTLDTSFGGGDGIVTTAIGSSQDYGQSVTVQSDGKILVGGHSHNGSSYEFTLTCYN